ncbi:MAG: putative PIN family toxin of toxin-antitoxin system [Cyclobacteriaceae bacterium]
MKVFADTNFLVSAFATRGLSSEVFGIVIAGHELIFSEQVLSELEEKLSKKFRIPENQISKILDFLKTFQILKTPTKKSKYQVRDEDDEWIIAAALESNVDVLITGDNDLLSIVNEVSKVQIITPRQFWELVRY